MFPTCVSAHQACDLLRPALDTQLVDHGSTPLIVCTVQARLDRLKRPVVEDTGIGGASLYLAVEVAFDSTVDKGDD